MKCPGCSKFAPQEAQVEVDHAEISSDGHIQVDVRIVLVSECCQAEMKEATLTVEADLSPDAVAAHAAPGCLLDVEAEAEPSERFEGKGRGIRHFYGADVTVAASCGCGKNDFTPIELHDDIQSSHMDDC